MYLRITLITSFLEGFWLECVTPVFYIATGLWANPRIFSNSRIFAGEQPAPQPGQQGKYTRPVE
jgi:hypothetical protein